MAGSLSRWDMREVNDWWRRGIEKERARMTNAPKPFKHAPLSVPTDFSNFAPPMPKKKRRDA